MAAINNHPTAQSIKDTVTNGSVSVLGSLIMARGSELTTLRHRRPKTLMLPDTDNTRACRTERKSGGCEDE